eukprot:snap_masked-scaffold_39-processed-gene-2.11-mRNA-1 protein AED:1.00 eAED:1.00 QI:0/0/0/0/1/1/5/0/80
MIEISQLPQFHSSCEPIVNSRPKSTERQVKNNNIRILKPLNNLLTGCYSVYLSSSLQSMNNILNLYACSVGSIEGAFFRK